MRSKPLTEYSEHRRSSDESRKTSNVLRVSKMGDKRRSRKRIWLLPHFLRLNRWSALGLGSDYEYEKKVSERCGVENPSPNRRQTRRGERREEERGGKRSTRCQGRRAGRPPLVILAAVELEAPCATNDRETLRKWSTQFLPRLLRRSITCIRLFLLSSLAQLDIVRASS